MACDASNAMLTLEGFMENSSEPVNAAKAREIIEATYHVVLEDGFAQAGIRKIAARAGVSKYMIHYYFGDKNTLLVELIKKVVWDLNREILEIIARYPTNEERIEKGIRDFWEGFKQDPGHLAILQESVIYGRRIPEIKERIIGFYRGMVEQLADIVASDPTNRRELTKKEAAALVIHLFAALDGLAIQYMRDPRLVDYDANLELLIRSLKSFIS